MQALKETLGERAFNELGEIIIERIKLHSISRDELKGVPTKLEIVEHDLEDVKTGVRELRKEMNERFDRTEVSLDERFDKMNERFNRVNERFDQMYERMTSLMKWTVGTLVLFGSIVSILLALGQFLK